MNNLHLNSLAFGVLLYNVIAAIVIKYDLLERNKYGNQ